MEIGQTSFRFDGRAAVDATGAPVLVGRVRLVDGSLRLPALELALGNLRGFVPVAINAPAGMNELDSPPVFTIGKASLGAHELPPASGLPQLVDEKLLLDAAWPFGDDATLRLTA